ncbi:MAG: butyrate kinase, partial [Synergistaceae bacterium]|nr:butyrate kinase [Synergistaceae bacterium]
EYVDCVFVIAHLGGGISMSLHKYGRVIDVIGDDEGPFSPERAGGQQIIQFVKYMQDKGGMKDKLKIMRGESGLAGYLGTSDARDVEKMIAAGDEKAKVVYEAMACQIAKSIASLAASAYGKLDNIILTGGLAHSKTLVKMIDARTSFIAPMLVYPGENEMESLAHGAYRILTGEETAEVFKYD